MRLSGNVRRRLGCDASIWAGVVCVPPSANSQVPCELCHRQLTLFSLHVTNVLAVGASIAEQVLKQTAIDLSIEHVVVLAVRGFGFLFIRGFSRNHVNAQRMSGLKTMLS